MARLLLNPGTGMGHVEDVLQGWPNQAAIVVEGMDGGGRWESDHYEMAVVLEDPSFAAHSFDLGTWKGEAPDTSGQRLVETKGVVGH
jgi:hypothetical protein